MRKVNVLVVAACLALPASLLCGADLESESMLVKVDAAAGRWSITDKRSGVSWPSKGEAAVGSAAFKLVDKGRSLEIIFSPKGAGEFRALGDLLGVTQREGGAIIVPCREGLLVRAGSGKTFRRTFGASDYEGCHMNMLGLIKSGAAMAVDWDDAYVFPELQGTQQRLTAEFRLRKSGRTLRLTPLGKGDWNAVAKAYRRIADRKGLTVTLAAKIRRNPKVERMIGAANVKLWTCLARKMNEASTAEESVNVRWTFDQAAQIAEHLHNDLGLRRCLFMIGGWTAGGYDCRHPDNLPANPEECGGNRKLWPTPSGSIQKFKWLRRVSPRQLPGHVPRRKELGHRSSSRSGPMARWSQGGRWLGGRAYHGVRAPKQLQLWPGGRRTFPRIARAVRAVELLHRHHLRRIGPRECRDPAHPIWVATRTSLRRSASATTQGKIFGLFGSECGREWALPHSDFFEGLVGVSRER